MAETETPPTTEPDAEDSLESKDNLESLGTEDVAAGSKDGVIDATSSNESTASSSSKPDKEAKKKGGLKGLLSKFNIYLLIFIFLLMLAGIILAIAYFQSKKASTSSTIKTQELTQNTLQQIAASDSTVGNNQQVLNVQSSAVFAGRVLVRDGLEVAGNLQVGGTVALTNLTITGTSQLGQVQVNKDLSVAGNTAIQGTASISKSLQVNGSGTFSGPLSSPQITTSNLQLNADLVLTHHVTAGGPTPGRTPGTALGGGGSVSVSGSDTAGAVSINTGSNPAAGCFVTVNFTSKYSSTPHVLLTPVGSGGGGLTYYVNRSTTNFSICVSSAAPAGTSFGFDYFVLN